MAGVINEPRAMRGSYLPFDDGCGIVGYSYECPECGVSNSFTDCETGCECGFSEPYVDPDDWYTEQMARAKAFKILSRMGTARPFLMED